MSEPLTFRVRLFIQEHFSGAFTVEVVGQKTLCVHVDDLDTALEDLELVLNDTLERSNPSRLHRTAESESQRIELVDVPNSLVLDGPTGKTDHPGQVSVVVTRDKRHQRLWLPRYGLRHWIDAKDDVATAVREFVAPYLKKRTRDDRLRARLQRREWLHSLEVRVEPAPLLAFTGKFLGASSLPVPLPKADVDDAESDRRSDGEKRPSTPRMSALGQPFHLLAKERRLERAFGREADLSRLIDLLSSPGGNAIALIGESSVGKTNLVHELAHRVLKTEQSSDFCRRPFFFIDGGRLIATDTGGWQTQVLEVVNEAIEAEAIWYVGKIEPLLDAGKSAHSDENVSDVLRAPLSGRRLTIIGECTEASWAVLELRSAAFARLWAPYRVQAPDAETTRRTLSELVRNQTRETGVVITERALDLICQLAARYSGTHSSHGWAFAFTRRLLADHQTRLAHRARQAAPVGPTLSTFDPAAESPLEQVGEGDVFAMFCRESGMPEFLVRDDRRLLPSEVTAFFEARIIGQDLAVARMTDLITLIKAGLSDLKRPMGSFLFVGPTGVGKTETAKALAEFVFGSRRRILRLDMSEFLTAQSVHRLIGAHSDQQLVAAIRQQPFSVLLLDEIEKAHPAVFDVLLQVLGEARLSDEAGRTADFRNVIVIMTSNLGVDSFRPCMGFSKSADRSMEAHFRAEAERFFRPEFFNRLDHLVPFSALGAEAIDKITNKELSNFLDRDGLRHGHVSVELGEAVPDWLAGRGVDERYGARPLKRIIEAKLGAELAEHLSDAHDGPRRVRVSVRNDALHFQDADVKAASQRGRAARRQLVVRASGLRRELDRWMRSRVFLHLDRSLRLFDRMASDPNFWTVPGSGAPLDWSTIRTLTAVRDRMRAHRTQVCWLEDMAYKDYFEGVTPDDTLLELVDQAGIDLLESKVEVACTGFRYPDNAMLYFQPGRRAGNLVWDLCKAYLMIAERKKWDVGVHVPPEVKDGAASHSSKGWILLARRQPGDHSRFDIPAQIGDSRHVLLSVAGPRAGALLSGESGMVQRQQQREVVVCKVLAKNQLLIDELESLEFGSVVSRVINVERAEVTDKTMVERVSLQNGLGEALRQLMFKRLLEHTGSSDEGPLWMNEGAR